MSQGSSPLAWMPEQHGPLAGLPRPGGTRLAAFSHQAACDDLFRLIGLPLAGAYRLLARDCLFTHLGKITQGAGEGGGSLAARMAIDEPSLRLGDDELRRGVAGLGPPRAVVGLAA